MGGGDGAHGGAAARGPGRPCWTWPGGCLAAQFLAPVTGLAAATAALAAGVGFLPVRGAAAGLGPVATGAAVSLLALVTAIAQPLAGRARDAGRLADAPAWPQASVLAAAGLACAALLPGLAGLLPAALLAGIGIGAVTPLGFAALAASAPPGRLGQTMGAAEVGRELGDAGGPVLVGAFGLISLTAGFGVLAAALMVCAALIAPRNRKSPPLPGPSPGSTVPTSQHSQTKGEGRADGRLTD